MKYSITPILAVVAAAFVNAGEPVKVFILAGQSNMEGAGRVEGDPNHNGGKGSLSFLAENDPEYAHLRKGATGWKERDDVSIWFLGRKGDLAPGFGSRDSTIGPELGFGYVVGDAFEEPVLLIKTAWGGKSLAVDFRPPSSGGEVGPFYTQMLGHVKKVLEDLDKEFSQYKDGYEIVGFGWHQGWNDGCDMAMCQEYKENMKNFIRDVRKDLGVPDLPFVIADSGFGGEAESNNRRLMIREGQAAPMKASEFKDTVFCVRTAPFWRTAEESPSKQGYHWNSNAESYYLIGKAMGEAMVKLAGGSDSSSDSSSSIHTFRNSDGSKSFEGRLIGYDAGTGKVTVQPIGKKNLVFDLSYLHAEDQEYVKSRSGK